MFRPDAQEKIVLLDVNKITIETILQIQKGLEPYDITSMVFLLYEVPNTALERLITYHRVCRDVGINNLNLLSDWVSYAQSRSTWRYEFLEALSICRLHNIIKKLGYSVDVVKQQFNPDSIHISYYIHSMKKLLYIISENMTCENLDKLKSALMSYKFDVTHHEHCEMVFLELMCQKFIVLNQIIKGEKTGNEKMEVEMLAEIIESLRGMKNYALQMREIVKKFNFESKLVFPNEYSNPTTSKVKICDLHKEKNDIRDVKNMKEQDQSQILHEKNVKKVKSDSFGLHRNIYSINNPKRVGVCCIINQEKFHPSKSSIKSDEHKTVILEDRYGSDRDQIELEETMKSFNFIVKTKCNLKRKEMIEFIRECIEFSTQEDSIFVLCILSHGVKGHVYSSDSLKVNVGDIQKLLDSSDAYHLHNKPKVLLLQSCQENDTSYTPKFQLVTDGPNRHLQKSNFLIYWATAPEHVAFRDEKKGSIFIQTLCYFLKKYGAVEQLSDICTIVTNHVTNFCIEKECEQVPLFESTLTKKLYLCPQVD